MYQVTPLRSGGAQAADQIGRIMPFLSPEHDGSPVNVDYLKRIVDSPSSVQLIAKIIDWEAAIEVGVSDDVRRSYPIVGAATLSTLHGTLGEKAWLEDFVVIPEVRKMGVAQGLWGAMTEWRIEKGLYQMRFNSTANRERAHSFYHRNGCQELSTGMTTLFVHNLDK